MTQVLVDHPLLTLFLVVALGAAVGAIRVGPVRLGAAGALFVGLLFSAFNPELAEGYALVQQIGLALFVYTVGLASGATFVATLRTNMPLILGGAGAAVVGGVVAAVGGTLLGLPKALSTGLFTGALTAAPALEAASRLTGSGDAAVGYSAGYPLGVLVGIIAVSFIATAHWRGPKDTEALAGRGLHALTVRVEEPIMPMDIEEWREQRVRFSLVHREGRTRVLAPGEELRADDLVVVVGEPGGPEDVAEQIGQVVPKHLADDRTSVDFERVVLSNPDLAGRTIAQLGMSSKFGAMITRVRRGDLDLLARDDLALQAGDNLAVAVPEEHFDQVKDYLGDSQKRVSEIDALPLGIGLVLGMALGMVAIPLPGGSVFQLGTAAGPLVVGMILGALRRTGLIVWSMPESANLTIRHLGLLLFLTALGLSAGPDVAALFQGPMGVKAIVLSVIIAAVGCLTVVLAGWFMGLSAPRTAGAVAGFLGQPAVLQAADARVKDERIASSYSALFAVAILVKILLVPLVWSL